MANNAREIIEEEVRAIQAIHIEQFPQAIGHILLCKGKLVFVGMGKAGLIAQKIAATFASTGTPSFFMHPSEAQHGDLGMLSEGDMIIALSNSGKTREVIETIHLAKAMIEHVPLITITSDPNSELAQIADVVLLTGGYKEVCPFGMAPTSSTTAMLVIGDILAVLTMQQKDFKLEDYAKRHHGGYLGTKTKEILGR